MPDVLSESDVKQRLTTRIIGADYRHLPLTHSTQDDVSEAGRAGAAEGLTITADEQTRGRGRFRRSWMSPPGASLLGLHPAATKRRTAAVVVHDCCACRAARYPSCLPATESGDQVAERCAHRRSQGLRHPRGGCEGRGGGRSVRRCGHRRQRQLGHGVHTGDCRDIHEPEQGDGRRGLSP